MKYLILVLLIISALKLSAQSQFIGGITGVNTSFVLGKSILEKPGKLGFRTGINYTYKGEEDFLFEIGFLYQQKGFKEKESQTDHPTIYNMDYLSYPVKFGLIIKGTYSAYLALKIGLVPAMLIHSYNNSNQPNIDNDTPIFDLGGAIDFAIGYVFNEKIDLYMKLGYEQSFFTSAVNFLPNQKLLNSSIDMSIGLRYSIPL